MTTKTLDDLLADWAISSGRYVPSAVRDTILRAHPIGLASAGEEWRPIETRPEFDQQPTRQFILIEGERTHNGTGPWLRQWAGVAFIDRTTPHGYRAQDIAQMLAEGDMDHWGWSVTHWMPAQFPAFPPRPLPAPPVTP